MSYRDEKRAASHHAQQLWDRVMEREQLLTPELMRQLPAGLLENIRGYRLSFETRVWDDAADHVRKIEEYDALLDRVFALAPDLELDLNTLPTDIHPDQVSEMRGLSRLHALPEMWDETTQRLPKYLAELGKDVQVDEPKPYVIDATLTYRSTPIALRMQPHVVAREYTGEVGIAIGTPVRKSTPALDIRPLAFSHGFTKALRIHRDIEIGDEEIDGRFLIQGDPEFAKQVLDLRNRNNLLKIATFDVPFFGVIHVEELRIARVWWRWDAKIGALKAALRLLARLRAMDTTVSMLHES